MSDGLPKISIVTPCYNCETYLERAMESVFRQQYPDLEYIVMDGASTDGSVDIIRKFDDRLTYWESEKDNGQTHAINKGFKRCTGEIVAWFNGDDIYCDGAFQAVGEYFAAHPEVDVVFGNTFSIDENDRAFRHNRNVPFWWPAQIVVGGALPQPAAFWRKSLLDKYGLLDESLKCTMDYEFFCRIGNKAKFKHIRKDIISFRIHSAQVTQAYEDIGTREHNAARDRYMKEACGIWPPAVMKVFASLHKMFWHLVQGEFGYAARGLVRRASLAAKR